MKRMLVKLTLFILVIFSSIVSADEILLTGKPVVLVPNSDFYSFPRGYVSTDNFHFVNLSGDNRVCYINAQPQLKDLDLLRINIAKNNKVYLWYCYRYDPRYFTLDY